jgi:hypothetical protein
LAQWTFDEFDGLIVHRGAEPEHIQRAQITRGQAVLVSRQPPEPPPCQIVHLSHFVIRFANSLSASRTTSNA